jgi:hypothetical protein
MVTVIPSSEIQLDECSETIGLRQDAVRRLGVG